MLRGMRPPRMPPRRRLPRRRLLQPRRSPRPLGVQWEADYTKAVARAKAEGKDLFVNFTGSDWCGYCIKLEEEIFTKPEFAAEASKHFVFVFMDHPRDAALKAKVVDTALRDKLGQTHGIRGFPSIVLMSADETPYGMASYKRGFGPKEYLTYLDDHRARRDAIQHLSKMADKATAADVRTGWKNVKDAGLTKHSHFAWVMDHIAKVDPTGSEGLKAVRDAHLASKAFGEYLQTELGPKMQSGATPDWLKVFERIKTVEPAAVKGDAELTQAYIFLTLRSSQALADANRCDDARLGVKRVAEFPSFVGHPKVVEDLAKINATLDAAKKAPAEAAPESAPEAAEEAPAAK